MPPDPSPEPTRGPVPRSSLSPVHRAAIEDYLEALEEQREGARTALRERHPQLATEFDAVESAYKRLSARLPRGRASLGHTRAGNESVDPGISLDRAPGGAGPGATGATPGSPTDSDLLERIAERSAPPARYRARREIARGGMGSIQRVWDEDLRRYLVMKVMLRPQDRNPNAQSVPLDSRQLSRFLEEAQITGQLDHPGILPVHDIGIDEDGRIYFTMPLVKGQDLAQIIERARNGTDGWTLNRVLNVLIRVMEATAFAHDRGVVHRDLKPENIMVGRFGEAYVMDWGLARVLDQIEKQKSEQSRSMAATLKRRVKRSAVVAKRLREGPLPGRRGSAATLDGDLVGTPGYMAPEQARGDRSAVGPRSDIYALGAIVYQLLTGYRPYDDPISRSSERPLLERMLEERPIAIKELERDQPDELVAICDKAMAEDPEDRYASVIEMIEDVRAFLEGHVVRAYETGLLAEVRKWVVRNRVLAGFAAATGLAIVGAAITVGVQQQVNLDRLREEKEATDQARADAEAEAERADMERNQAEIQSAQAEKARREFEELARQLEARNEVADVNLEKAKSQEEIANRQAYVGYVAGAASSLRLNELGEARRLLTACEREFRRWEWQYLRARTDVSLRTHSSWLSDPVALTALDDERVAVLDADRGLAVISLESGARELERSLRAGLPRDLVHDSQRRRLWISRGPAPLLGIDLDGVEPDIELGGRFAQETGALEWGPLALSPDGRAIVAGVAASGLEAGDLAAVVFDVNTGERRLDLNSPSMRSVTAVAWSPDGATLAVGSRDGFVQLWDAATGEALGGPERPQDQGVTALAFGEDASRLAIGSRSSDVTLFDATARTVLGLLRGHSDTVTDVVFAPFDRYLVTSSEDGTLALWEPNSGLLLGQLRGHDDDVLRATVTPDGQQVASLSRDRTLRVWDPASPESVSSIRQRRPIGGAWLTTSDDDRTLVLPVGNELTLLDLETLQTRSTLDTRPSWAGPGMMRAGRDELLVAVGTQLVEYDGTSGERLGTLLELPDDVEQLALSADGDRLAAAGADPTDDDRQVVLLWELERIGGPRSLVDETGPAAGAQPPLGAYAAYSLEPGVRVSRLALTADGRHLALTTDGGRVWLIDMTRPGAARLAAAPLSLHQRAEAVVTFDLAWLRIVAAAPMGASHTVAGLPPGGPLTPSTALALSPDGDWVAVGFADGRIELWPLPELLEADDANSVSARTLLSNSTAIRSLAFDPRGERLVSGAEDGSVRVFELELGTQLLRLAGDGPSISAVSFSRSGQELFSLDQSGSLELYTARPLIERFEARREAQQQRRAARNQVLSTLEGFVSMGELLSRVDEGLGLDENLREGVNAVLRAKGNNAGRLNADAWELVRTPDGTAEEYRDAFLWAAFANALEPEEPLYQRTLGVAKYRLGRWAEAIELLGESSGRHRNGPRAEELAVLALCYGRLGDQTLCTAYRAQLDVLMSKGAWSRDAVARSFAGEVRSLLGSPASAGASGGATSAGG